MQFNELNIYGKILMLILLLFNVLLYTYLMCTGYKVIQKNVLDYCSNPYSDISTTIFGQKRILHTYSAEIVEAICDKNIKLFLFKELFIPEINILYFTRHIYWISILFFHCDR
jgi:hypothetical protein